MKLIDLNKTPNPTADEIKSADGFVVMEQLTEAEFKERYGMTLPNVNRFGQRTEFCAQCGAGLGQHRREGEGTCPACDPPRPKPEKLANGRKVVYPIWRDDLAEATILPCG